MNYFYPGDKHLAAKSDPIAEKYGAGATHASTNRVERIVQMRIGADAIQLVDTAPLKLELRADGESRNWEGLAQLDDLGFLLVTDSFPTTIFGFVPNLR
jgi:hypothetical protein